MNSVSYPPEHRSSAAMPEQSVVSKLRALSAYPRLRLVPMLNRTLQECACWTRNRCGGPCSLLLELEVGLRTVTELYVSLVECGLEFDRRSHRELAMLCTLEQHTHGTGRRKMLDLQLELIFEDELGPTEFHLCATLA